VLNYYREAGKKGFQQEHQWHELNESYKETYLNWQMNMNRSAMENCRQVERKIACIQRREKIATRKASGKTLNAIAESLPLLIGGSADLAPSTDTLLEKYESFRQRT